MDLVVLVQHVLIQTVACGVVREHSTGAVTIMIECIIVYCSTLLVLSNSVLSVQVQSQVIVRLPILHPVVAVLVVLAEADMCQI